MESAGNFHIVQPNDTLEKIAAHYNITPGRITSLNKLHGHFLFDGQHLKLPRGTVLSARLCEPTLDSSAVTGSDLRISSAKDEAFESQADQHCPKFLKIRCKYITQFDGSVSGTLLVTPNSVMFEPDLTHALIIENGSAGYTVTARLDHLVSIALFENLPLNSVESMATMVDRNQVTHKQYGSENGSFLPVQNSSSFQPGAISTDSFINKSDCYTKSKPIEINAGIMTMNGISSYEEQVEKDMVIHSSVSSNQNGHNAKKSRGSLNKVQFSLFETEDQRLNSESFGEIPVFDGQTPLVTSSIDLCPSFAQVTVGSLNEEAEKLSPSPDKVIAVDHCLEKKRIFKRSETMEKLLEKTNELRLKTQFPWAADNDSSTKIDQCANELDELAPGIITPQLPHYLCVKVHRKFLPQSDHSHVHHMIRSHLICDEKLFYNYWFAIPKTQIDPLYTFLLHRLPEKLDRKQHFDEKSTNLGEAEAEKKRNSLGFVLLDKSDDFGAILSPSAHQQQFAPVEPDPAPDPATGAGTAESSDYLLNLNQQWEIVTVEEVERRMSELDFFQEPTFYTLPDGSDRPVGLSDPMLDQLIRALPARAQGYPWILIYSTEAHGFSLNTLYRNMATVRDYSPTVLLVTDSLGGIFGITINCPIRMTDGCYGSGESFLFAFSGFSGSVDSTTDHLELRKLTSSARRQSKDKSYQHRSSIAHVSVASHCVNSADRCIAHFPADGIISPNLSTSSSNSSSGQSTCLSNQKAANKQSRDSRLSNQKLVNKKSRDSNDASADYEPVDDGIFMRQSAKSVGLAGKLSIFSPTNRTRPKNGSKSDDEAIAASIDRSTLIFSAENQQSLTTSSCDQILLAANGAQTIASDCREKAEMQIFRWTGANNYVINAQKHGLGFGLDAGRFGLFLDADLNRGTSQACATFGNSRGLSGAGEFFDVTRVEAFAFFVDDEKF